MLASPQSGCRRPGAVAAADALLRTPLAQAWRPEMVLRLGATWASRVVNDWLGGLACPQVLVDPGGTWAAPDRLPSDVVVASPEAVCRAVASAMAPGAGDSWADGWSQAEARAQVAIEAVLRAEARPSEPGVARWLVGAAPAGASVVVSSSMPVRDVEAWSMPRAGVRVLANRGANGIDGVLSTALGVAAARPRGGVVALLGDLAFLYDAGALLAGGRGGHGLDLDVVVIDNQGGGILQLPGPGGQPATGTLRADVGHSAGRRRGRRGPGLRRPRRTDQGHGRFGSRPGRQEPAKASGP